MGSLAPRMGVSAENNVKSSQNYKLELTAALLLSVHQRGLVLSGESEESLLEGYVKRPDGSLLVVPGPFQVLDRLPGRQPVAGSTVAVIVPV